MILDRTQGKKATSKQSVQSLEKHQINDDHPTPKTQVHDESVTRRDSINSIMSCVSNRITRRDSIDSLMSCVSNRCNITRRQSLWIGRVYFWYVKFLIKIMIFFSLFSSFLCMHYCIGSWYYALIKISRIHEMLKKNR